VTTYTVQPITDRTWIGSKPRIPSRFESTWSQTLAKLRGEVSLLGGKEFVIEMDISAEDLKLDGELRTNARPTTPAVVVAFESKHGPLTYRCDRFYTNYYNQGPEWQHNVRAIALTLESLRAVDRYGATETGQQYTGFKAIGAGRAMPASHMTTDAAIAIFAALVEIPAEHLNTEISSLRSTYRKARRLTHPDKHAGDRTLWDQVEQAAAVLGVLE
jgi:hypothetical protein